jgi:hypothetical protein
MSQRERLMTASRRTRSGSSSISPEHISVVSTMIENCISFISVSSYLLQS